MTEQRTARALAAGGQVVAAMANDAFGQRGGRSSAPVRSGD